MSPSFVLEHWPALVPGLAPILLDAALKSVRVMTAAGVAALCMRRCSAAARHLVWFSAIAGLVALPLLSWALPAWHILPHWMSLRPNAPATASVQQIRARPVSPPPRQQVELSAVSEPPAAVAQEPPRPEPVQMPVASRLKSRAAVREPFNPSRLALGAWLAGVVFALVPTVLGLISLWRLERSSRQETSPEWLELLQRLLGCLGCNRRVALLKTARRRMPMIWGILRPNLLLPEGSTGWPEERRRVVMLHELAHAKRWDYLTNLITQLVSALYWFNPLVWLATRRMVAERERACDDIVLSQGAEPADYAEQVLEIAAGFPLGRLAALGGIAMVRPSKLEDRLRAILDGSCNRAALTGLAVLSALALAAVVVVPVAMVKAAPGPAATPSAQGGAGAAAPLASNSVAASQPATLVGRWYDGRDGVSSMLELNADGSGRIVSERADPIRWEYNKDTGLVSLSYIAQYDPKKTTKTLRFSPDADTLVGEFYGPDDKEHTFRRPSRSASSSRSLGASVGAKWGAAVEGFQVRLHAPSAAERQGDTPRLLVDISNEGPRRFICTTNYHLWQLELDGSWYVAAASMESDPLIDGTSGPGSVGALREVFPGYPWTNLPLVLNAAWRTAHSNEVGTAQLGGSGIGYSQGFRPERLKLAAGKHTVRLAVLGAPKFAGGGGPVRAISQPVDVEVRTNEQPPVQTGGDGPGGAPAEGARLEVRTTNSSPGLAASAAAELPPLERRVSLSAQQMPLKNALAEVCRAANVQLDLDVEGLKSAGLAADLPVTVSFKDERLDSALPRILAPLERQGFHGIYREMRGNKVFVSSLAARQARTLSDLPDWLKPLYNNGLVVKLDDDRNVISIYVGEKADDEFLAKIKTLPRLREVDIEVTKGITPAGLAHLAELPALVKLNLYEVNRDGAGLGNDALRVVTRIKTLRNLSIARCGVTDNGVRVLEGMTQLTALRLSGNQLTDAAMKSLAGLTNLQSLDLSGPMQITDEGIKHFSRLTDLRELSVDSLQISGNTISFPHLQSLGLSGGLVTDAALDSLVQCRELRYLGLMYTEVSDEGLKRVANLKELRRLSLSSRLITDAGIAHLKALPKLEHVELRATGVSDESLRHLCQIKSLTRLDLHGSGEPGVNPGRLFTIQGLQQLKNVPQLRELWITNFAPPTGFLGLRELTQLRSLVLSFSNIKDAEVELLEAAMPDTRITAISGGLKASFPAQPVAARVPLPSASVYVSGQAVDDTSGEPVKDFVLQFGAADPAKPGEVTWGEALPGPIVEASGNEPQDPSRFWGESFRTGKVWARLLAGGYVPEPLTPSPVLAPFSMTNLVVRMKHGGDLHGVVLDHAGHPVPGMQVYLADKPHFSLRDGVTDDMFKSSTATTDPAGRFTLPGGNGTEQKVVVASADGHTVRVAPKVGPAPEVKLSLPEPATLAVRYDIPGDTPVARLFLNFEPKEPERSVWKDISFGLSPTVTNRGEVVLANLMPGTYRLARRKVLEVGGDERIAWLDESTLSMNAGRTQRVDLVRSAGHAVRGEVTGITKTSAFGAYIYAYSAQTTNGPADMLKYQRPLDALTCGKDGLFQTARLEPGTYTVVAIAFKEPAVYSHNREPDYIGTVKVIITAEAELPPVKIELLPWESAAKQPAIEPGHSRPEESPAASPKSQVRTNAPEGVGPNAAPDRVNSAVQVLTIDTNLPPAFTRYGTSTPAPSSPPAPSRPEP